MAQTGFVLTDEGRTITVLNDSGTTAIACGDLCYGTTNDDVITGTAARVRAAYAAGDIKVKSVDMGTTTQVGYRTILGVAAADIPADGYGPLAMEGVFMHAVNENVEAGNAVQANEQGTNKLQLADGGTSAGYEGFVTKIGRALSGGSADGKYIIWKLAL